ncbi:DUF1489 family protein [Pontixanthobacter gangjinensis]|uniref:DUF1489 family protein n=1 Tax=Pontixanthobacter gangjinensis TaxID=1028742 RepID=A0A6I4SLC7_9SPHN|nr:DUF1489 domain-containing protein [Pontixanthobacter gangjinensis]MXO56569.1 DUF1489 family protein [Pontixanthobacter gangjinensis]
MPLSITKIAYRSESIHTLRAWLEAQPDGAIMTTRYLPKRHEEMKGGSLYWIHDHSICARSPIQGFEQAQDGRWHIILEPKLILVEARYKRAHQGWRYLPEEKAPRDLGPDEQAGDVLPGKLQNKLRKLGLV